MSVDKLHLVLPTWKIGIIKLDFELFVCKTHRLMDGTYYARVTFGQWSVVSVGQRTGWPIQTVIAVSQHAEETGNIIASYQPCTLLYFVVNLMKELLNFGDKNAIVIYVYEWHIAINMYIYFFVFFSFGFA